MSPAETLIRLRDVSVGYRKPLLPPVSLDVRPGEFLGVVGPNGGGKSTLVRTMCGIIRPVRGVVEYPRGRPRIGYVPQREALDDIFPLSAREVVAMSLVPNLRLFQTLGRPQWRLADEWLARLGVGDLGDRPFRQLSFGQKQRVQLAAALVVEPDVLVLDEPDAALDPGVEERMLALVRRLYRERHMAVVLVSHQLNTTAALATRVAVVDQYRGVFRIGDAADVLRPEVLAELYGAEALICEHAGRLIVSFRAEPDEHDEAAHG